MPVDKCPSDSPQEQEDTTTPQTAGAGKTTAVPLLDSTDALEYSTESGTYRTEFDTSRDSPVEVVVHSVAAVANQSPLELAPLYDVVDPDALDTLLALPTDGHTGDINVAFTYQGYDVTLYNYGMVEVAPDGGDSVSS